MSENAPQIEALEPSDADALEGSLESRWRAQFGPDRAAAPFDDAERQAIELWAEGRKQEAIELLEREIARERASGDLNADSLGCAAHLPARGNFPGDEGYVITGLPAVIGPAPSSPVLTQVPAILQGPRPAYIPASSRDYGRLASVLCAGVVLFVAAGVVWSFDSPTGGSAQTEAQPPVLAEAKPLPVDAEPSPFPEVTGSIQPEIPAPAAPVADVEPVTAPAATQPATQPASVAETVAEAEPVPASTAAQQALAEATNDPGRPAAALRLIGLHQQVVDTGAGRITAPPVSADAEAATAFDPPTRPPAGVASATVDPEASPPTATTIPGSIALPGQIDPASAEPLDTALTEPQLPKPRPDESVMATLLPSEPVTPSLRTATGSRPRPHAGPRYDGPVPIIGDGGESRRSALALRRAEAERYMAHRRAIAEQRAAEEHEEMLRWRQEYGPTRFWFVPGDDWN